LTTKKSKRPEEEETESSKEFLGVTEEEDGTLVIDIDALPENRYWLHPPGKKPRKKGE